MAAKNKVEVGEAVGIVAAQSIGEPGTQMSLAYDEKVLVKEEEEIRSVKIGEFVDAAFERFGFVIENGHEICDLPVEIYAPSLTENEKIEWRRVSALSRHASPEKLLCITTRSGRKITATPFHSFVIRKENKIVPVAGSLLKVGEKLPVIGDLSSYMPQEVVSGDMIMKLMKKNISSDVVWEEIIGMEYVPASKEHVYDFTVPGTETFATSDGLITHNTMRTFHYAGVAEQVPTGLPRLIELVDARKEPKKPIMDVYLKEEYALSAEKAKQVAKEIECTVLDKVAYVEEDFDEKKIVVTLEPSELEAEGVAAEEVKKRIKAMSGLRVEAKEENVITVKPSTTTLRNIRRMTERLRKLQLKGIEKITRAIVVKMKDGNHFIRTSGSNLAAVIKSSKVDAERTYTNDVQEIAHVFGIEAARNALVREIKQVLDMQNLNVDIRHCMLLADAMTMDGEIKSVGRHGLCGEKAGVLARAAFEETVKHLISASIKGEDDRLIGVTENIIVGQTVPVGTGVVKLKMKL